LALAGKSIHALLPRNLNLFSKGLLERIKTFIKRIAIEMATPTPLKTQIDIKVGKSSFIFKETIYTIN
jgi:hypothetical protein